MSSTLYAKMARVMAATSYIEKDGKNPHFGYRFTTDSAVYNTIRQQLADNNLAVFASMVDVMQTEIAKDGGKKTWHTLAKFEFTIADGDSGEKFTCSWQAEADDQQDKGVNKCATAALKYWLLKTFVIPTGDDPDANEPPRHVPKGDQSRRIQTGPVQAPPEPPDDEQQVQPLKPSEVDALIEYARELRPDLADVPRAHLSNSCLKSCGLADWTDPMPGGLDAAKAAVEARALAKAQEVPDEPARNPAKK